MARNSVSEDFYKQSRSMSRICGKGFRVLCRDLVFSFERPLVTQRRPRQSVSHIPVRRKTNIPQAYQDLREKKNCKIDINFHSLYQLRCEILLLEKISRFVLELLLHHLR